MNGWEEYLEKEKRKKNATYKAKRYKWRVSKGFENNVSRTFNNCI